MGPRTKTFTREKQNIPELPGRDRSGLGLEWGQTVSWDPQLFQEGIVSGKAWPDELSALWASRPSDPRWVGKTQGEVCPGDRPSASSEAEITPRSWGPRRVPADFNGLPDLSRERLPRCLRATAHADTCPHMWLLWLPLLLGPVLWWSPLCVCDQGPLSRPFEDIARHVAKGPG